jgi:serine/threonine-protein kinase HipA
VPAVVIERYDRSPDAPQGRIHQEDFNQVLGAVGNQKYQKYGGKVSLERIALLFSALGDRGAISISTPRTSRCCTARTGQ